MERLTNESSDEEMDEPYINTAAFGIQNIDIGKVPEKHNESQKKKDKAEESTESGGSILENVIGRFKSLEEGSKTWPHAADALLKGHVVYNVKLLGNTEVDRAKGADLVKESVKKLKFNRHLKRSEGVKPRKVELTISANGVALQDRASHEKLYTFPLHRISYCADDKSDKRICAFIAKEVGTDKHICFVLDSEKCAEEITLTVGQAFDLAYKKFLDTSTKETDMKKQITNLQRKIQELEIENSKLKLRITELEGLPGLPPSYHESNAQVSEPATSGDLFVMDPFNPSGNVNGTSVTNGQAPSLFEAQPSIGNGHSVDHGAITNNSNNGIPAIPPPLATRRPRPQGRPQAGLGLVPPPGKPSSPNPFQAPTKPTILDLSAGGGAAPVYPTAAFNPFEVLSPGTGFDSPADQQMREMQEGFATGLTLSNDDFSLADLDPLNK
ncbi:PTB domain-containing engulfment adapter protein 1-like isoform X2 [Antedon mediterranea]|uniref:PTB domain-containing engulfment adapter protein 1-like isoform X2 n=1 Tax=Antedon mediterranea TaxID=105859 RepID=UPI003AF99080